MKMFPNSVRVKRKRAHRRKQSIPQSLFFLDSLPRKQIELKLQHRFVDTHTMIVGNKKLAIIAIFGLFLAGPVDAEGGLRIFDTERQQVRNLFLFLCLQI